MLELNVGDVYPGKRGRIYCSALHILRVIDKLHLPHNVRWHARASRKTVLHQIRGLCIEQRSLMFARSPPTSKRPHGCLQFRTAVVQVLHRILLTGLVCTRV